MPGLESFVKRAERAEAEIAELATEVERLEKLQGAPAAAAGGSEEVEKLRQENEKLKYRLGILKRATERELKDAVEMDETKFMPSVLGLLTARFQAAVGKSFPDSPDLPCPVAVSSKQGDYQFNGAMPIAGILKGQGVKTNPREVAAKIVSNVDKGSLIGKLEVAGPGFVNIHLEDSFVEEQVGNILARGVRPPFREDRTDGRKKIVVDFSSPNIAKEMHVGHLRSTIIGESVSTLFEFLGHDVLRLNHVGDWGTQFGMLIAHLKDEFPDYAAASPPIADLMAFYKESKKRFDEDEAFKKRAYASVVQLQSFDPDHIKAWNLICDVSRKEFQKVYNRLNVRLIERGESFYQKRMESVVSELKGRGVLEEDDGRLIMFAEGLKVPPLTIVKSDGGFTYDTSDMAALHQRVVEEKAQRIVYVTDAGQGPHFQTIVRCADRLGWLRGARVDHVGFGVVLGEDKKKFKTRSGDTVRLVDLLDEGVRRATEKLREKNFGGGEAALKKTAEALAYGCIKYADLSHNRNHEYVFSFDKMLDDKGNTAAYMMYAYARIRSIGRSVDLDPERLKATRPKLGHEKEGKLAKSLLRFGEVVLRVADDLFLHTLAEYVYEVATAFTEFYDVCYCVEKDKATGEIVKVNESRLALCEATAMVFKKCFDLLGLEAVDRM